MPATQLDPDDKPNVTTEQVMETFGIGRTKALELMAGPLFLVRFGRVYRTSTRKVREFIGAGGMGKFQPDPSR